MISLSRVAEGCGGVQKGAFWWSDLCDLRASIDFESYWATIKFRASIPDPAGDESVVGSSFRPDGCESTRSTVLLCLQIRTGKMSTCGLGERLSLK